MEVADAPTRGLHYASVRPQTLPSRPVSSTRISTLVKPSGDAAFALPDLYEFLETEEFVLRNAPPALIFNETNLSPIVEAVFGAFPNEERGKQFPKDYMDVFRPEASDPAVEHWFNAHNPSDNRSRSC